ncbi:MAG: HRDC domain-containing protein [Armatimonadia bacterium]
MTEFTLKLPQSSGRLITTSGALLELCKHLAAAKVFAFDTEFISECSYRPLLCLMQVATDERAELIDPLALADLGPLWELLADPTIEKVCYAGDQDLAIAWQLGRKKPQNVFDCQIGAGLVGIGYQEAYWRLVEIVAGVKLAKAHTYSDWSRRPLSKSQLKYALDDVLYLPEIHRMLRGRMETLGHMAWMREACGDVCAKAATDPDPEMIFAGIKGAAKLRTQQLAVLRELVILREQMACQEDKPARVMLKDEVLMDLAVAGPETEAQLSRIRSLPGSKTATYGAEIVRAVKRGKALPPEQQPYLTPPAEDSTETKRLSELMYASSQVICLGQSVSPKLVMSQAEIQGLARLISEGQDLSGHTLMSGWVGECLGEPLIDFVRGKTGLALNVKQGRMHAEFEASS